MLMLTLTQNRLIVRGKQDFLQTDIYGENR